MINIFVGCIFISFYINKKIKLLKWLSTKNNDISSTKL